MGFRIEVPPAPIPVQLMFDWHGCRHTVVVLATVLQVEHQTPRLEIQDGGWLGYMSKVGVQPSRVRFTIGGEVMSQNIEASLDPPRPIGMPPAKVKPKRKTRAKPRRKAKRRRR